MGIRYIRTRLQILIMNNLVASLGIAQLNKLKWLNSSREKLIKFYLKELANLKNIKPTLPHNLKDPPPPPSYWIFFLSVAKEIVL